MAQDIRPSFPSTCHQLNPEGVNPVGERPIAAGAFADIYETTYGNRKVVLKSYRCYVLFDVAQVVARFCNEVHVCNLLHQGGVDVVELVGMYSTEIHPFGLVYEHVGNLDLRQHLRNEPNVGRLKLLMEIALCLNRMHDLGIAHGNLKTSNILVSEDGTVRITGLGGASILSHSTARTVEGRTNKCLRLTRSGISPNPTDFTHPTKAGDMCAFGFMAWEVLTGRLPFPEMTGIAAMYSMLSGARPPQPNYHEISDPVWYMIEQCWHTVPSRRMSAEEAVKILDTELRRTSDSGTVPRA